MVLHGEPPGPAELALIARCDPIVCADGAANALLARGIRPTVIVGDMDSLSAAARRRAERLGIALEVHPPEKDRSDGELALDRLLSLRPRRVLVAGAHGRRTAHFLGNLKLLARLHDAGVDAELRGRGETVRFVTAGRPVRLTGRTGATVSVLPVGGAAVVSEEGLKWRLARVRIGVRSSRGLSNLVTSSRAFVRVHEGRALVVIEERPPKPT